ncbi:MAG: TIGR03619 family F420-dependent LLM class oxidoreductase [Actinomycetota bacterium]|nr:TIGR03619 family F420-dependent LLM class oxidoreductase [Actinomycetota bacterium]
MRRFDPAGGVLVVLHGHGDDPGSARRWGAQVAPLGWEVVAPGAPTRAGAEGSVRSWFGNGPRGAITSEVADAVARVGDVVQRVRAGGRKVAVAGFSQGGAVALLLDQFGVVADATVAVCAFLPELDDDPPAPPGATAASGPLLVLGGDRDDIVPPFMGEDAAAVLGAGGRDVTSEVLPGGHEVGAPMVDRAREWLTARFEATTRFSLGLPVDRVESGVELVSGAAIGELASAYERLGFHATYVTDHPAPDDRWLAGGGHQALEPTVALTAAAMVTRRIRLHTNVYVLTYRNPLLAAKALASVDVVSGGRLTVGVAAGYLRPEFAALGASFEDRGALLDEALRVLPEVWSTTGYQGEGAGWSARSVTALPTPVQRPGPPIWVGGNSNAALRRAVTSAQGWSPFPTPADTTGLRTAAISDLATLERRLARAQELCEEHGRTEPLTICFAPFGQYDYMADPVGRLDALVEEIAELRAVGVDWITLMVPGATRAAVLDAAAALAGALGLS